MKRNIFFSIIIFFCSFLTEAQDIHFTQYYTSPLNLNPAMTGFFDGTQRFTLQNKTQWQSVTTPFETVSASYDTPIWKRYLKHDIFGGGVVFNRDQEGDSKFGTTQANLSLSYIHSISRINNQFVSCGIQAGVAQRTIDYSNLVFDDQWNGSSVNTSQSNNEQFSTSNFAYFDLSAGAYWSYMQHNRPGFSAGIALYHINTPKQSLMGNETIRLDRKLLISGNTMIDATSKIKVIPGILIMQQGTYNEVDIGAIGKFIQMPAEVNYLALSFGLYYRFKDAINAIAGLDYKEFSFGVSYDVNVSGLVLASHARGGLELSLVYLMKKNKKTYQKKIPCPIF